MRQPKNHKNKRSTPIRYAPYRRQEVVHSPVASYEDDAGYDLVVSRPITVYPRMMAQIPTNLVAEIPEGYWGLLVARSSAFFRRFLLIPQGVIDTGYRGEIMAVGYNIGDKQVQILPGERLFQLILIPKAPHRQWERAEGDVLPESGSMRGDAGFGSTGGMDGDQQEKEAVKKAG